jgi:hypothetical protein
MTAETIEKGNSDCLDALVVQRNFIALEQPLTVSMADSEGHGEACDEGVSTLSF